MDPVDILEQEHCYHMNKLCLPLTSDLSLLMPNLLLCSLAQMHMAVLMLLSSMGVAQAPRMAIVGPEHSDQRRSCTDR